MLSPATRGTDTARRARDNTITNTRELPAAARGIKVGGHLLFDGTPGLRLVRSMATRWVWTYRYRSPVDPTKLVQLRIGRWPTMPLHAATAAWQKLSDE